MTKLKISLLVVWPYLVGLLKSILEGRCQRPELKPQLGANLLQRLGFGTNAGA